MEENNIERVNRCIVIGGSAGSLKVILNMMPYINPSLPAPVIIVLHRKETSSSSLEELLATRTALKVKEAEDKEPIKRGTIYLAPPDYHLLIEKDATLSLDASEKINFSRPSIDATFQTAGEAFEKDLLAILLSGANSDGTDGLACILHHKGQAAVQDPQTAQVPFMPAHAIARIRPSFIVREAEIASLINAFGNGAVS